MNSTVIKRQAYGRRGKGKLKVLTIFDQILHYFGQSKLEVMPQAWHPKTFQSVKTGHIKVLTTIKFQSEVESSYYLSHGP